MNKHTKELSMSSPYLVRWRVKDLASCFYACRFPSEEENGTFGGASRKGRNEVFDSSKVSAGKGSRKVSHVVKKKMMRGENGNSSASGRSNNNNNNKSSVRDGESRRCRWPRFAEEDYIVFCFREDGAIHMINEDGNNLSESLTFDDHKDISSTNTPNLSPKVPYGERVGHRNWDSSRGGLGMPNYIIHHTNYQEEIPILNATGDENGSNEVDSVWPPDEIKEINAMTDQEPNSTQKTDSFESCDSNVSDTSSTSFAFPVLGIEWMGSPVQMPKSEKLIKARNVLHCCRF